jgi:hypothetical protein
MGDRRYSSYSYLTSALDGGEWSASHPGSALPPVPIAQEAGWAPEPVWTQTLEDKSSASVGDRTPVVQSVVRHYTDRATLVRTTTTTTVALGGLVVSVLATGPKVRGFKPGQGRWILRAINSVARLPSEGK